MNFKNFGNEPPPDGEDAGGGGRCGGKPPDNFPLARQQSIYSLTFDEFQSTLGGFGKDFGSMNMDELLKNIWSAEETQTVGSTSGGRESGALSGYLQRQGSLTLPRTLSQKTVDEVWRDIANDYGGGKDGNGAGGSNLPQRQQTLGEMTLEEFLVRAGAVREEIQLPVKPNIAGFFGDLWRPSNDTDAGSGFQQIGQNTGLVGNKLPESNSQNPIQSANLPLNVKGLMGNRIFPNQPTLDYAHPMSISNNTKFGNSGTRSGIVGNTDSSMNCNLVQSDPLQGGGMDMIGLGAGAVTVAVYSPADLSDGLGKNNGNASSVLPVPYVFNGGLRERKCVNVVEKVVERRQRRMIKNRESAARSRARKQAYSAELEEEVAKLKEENQQLRKKEAEIMELQKKQELEMKILQQGVKRQCLRRTQTSPW